MTPADLLGRWYATPRVIHPEQVLIEADAAWKIWYADLGGKWYGEQVDVAVEGDVVELHGMGVVFDEVRGEPLDDLARVLKARFRRRQIGARSFLVPEGPYSNHVARFDATVSASPDDWYGISGPYGEAGHDAFLRLDLAAHWQRILDDLRQPGTQSQALNAIDRGRLQLRLPDDGSSVDDRYEHRSALVEGFSHVDPSVLLAAILDAEQRPEPLTWNPWWGVLQDLEELELPASIGTGLRARLAALLDR